MSNYLHLLFSVADPGCSIPDPNFSIPDQKYSRSRILIRIKELKYFSPQKLFLSSRAKYLGCSSRIRIFSHSGSSSQSKAPDLANDVRNNWTYLLLRLHFLRLHFLHLSSKNCLGLGSGIDTVGLHTKFFFSVFVCEKRKPNEF